MLGRRRRVRRRRMAVIGGAAAVAKRRHDANETQLEDEQPAADQSPSGAPDPPVEPAAEGGLTDEAIEQLKELGELHEQNVLTDEEFDREKSKLLGSA